MALLEVRIIGDPVLDKVADPVDEVDGEVRQLLDDMVDTMRAEQGIGLAAPQVGVSKRLMVVDVDGRVFKLVNPRITDTEGRSKGVEACLSVPDIEGEVERPDRITLEYVDPEGEPGRLEASGLLARCIQHEYDHLDGVLFVQRLSAGRRLMLKKKIRALRKQTRERLKAAAG